MFGRFIQPIRQFGSVQQIIGIVVIAIQKGNPFYIIRDRVFAVDEIEDKTSAAAVSVENHLMRKTGKNAPNGIDKRIDQRVFIIGVIAAPGGPAQPIGAAITPMINTR